MKVTINARSVGQVVNADVAHVGGPSPQPAPATLPPVPGGRLFISYAHEDRDWLGRFRVVLSPLVRDGAVSTWWDGDIRPSDRWREAIDTALESATAALLLVTPDFLASDFIMTHELPRLLAVADAGRLRLTWVLVRNCLYQHTRIGEFQAVHDIARPLGALAPADADDVLVSACQHLAGMVGRR